MLDSAIKNQLMGLFQSLPHKIDLAIDPSDHDKQSELLEMLEEVASTSEFISVKMSDNKAPTPRFTLLKDGVETGITFQGVPGGHEFTSFIVALLNISGKGKLPDEGIQARIKRLDPKLEIRTYVSLSCENCPDIVQAFNQIVLSHGGGIRHTMIDGGHVPEELQALNIQGVPSVWVGDEMIHSGRGTFAELLSKLESKYVDQNQSAVETNLGHFGVAVLGG
ncbi:MAG: alkyl hydroperoxide reductase subunit F, partial [Proteobacteria bacterium]